MQSQGMSLQSIRRQLQQDYNSTPAYLADRPEGGDMGAGWFDSFVEADVRPFVEMRELYPVT